MLGLYRKVIRFPNTTSGQGIFQTYYPKFPNFYDLIWDPDDAEGSRNKNCIINANDYCITKNQANSSYIFVFSDFLLNLSGIFYLSAVNNRCAYNFDISALDIESGEWNIIKNVREEPRHFFKTPQYIDCYTKAYTNSIKFVLFGQNEGITYPDGYQFIIRSIEFYGELLAKASVITFISKLKFNYFPYFFITLNQS